jgi:hypothetical protein
MTAYTRRIRLLPHVVPAPEVLIALADRLGWEFYEERTEEFIDETIWVLADGESFARWIADGVIEKAYLQFEGPLAEESAGAARGEIVATSEADATAALASAASEPDAIERLREAAVVASYEAFNVDLFEAIVAKMRHPAASVRRAAALAASYPGWRQFEPRLVELTRDADPGVRETSSLALQALRSMRWSPS